MRIIRNLKKLSVIWKLVQQKLIPLIFQKMCSKSQVCLPPQHNSDDDKKQPKQAEHNSCQHCHIILWISLSLQRLNLLAVWLHGDSFGQRLRTKYQTPGIDSTQSSCLNGHFVDHVTCEIRNDELKLNVPGFTLHFNIKIGDKSTYSSLQMQRRCIQLNLLEILIGDGFVVDDVKVNRVEVDAGSLPSEI